MYERESQENLREAIISEALKLVGFDSCNHPKDGENHNLGCFPETGLDCSGFIIYVLHKAGIAIPEGMRHVSEFFDHFGILTHRQRQGDLVFFSKKGLAPTHVGIIVNDREYVHSPGRYGAKIAVAELKRTPIPLQYTNQLYLENPIGFKTPTVSNGRWQSIL